MSEWSKGWGTNDPWGGKPTVVGIDHASGSDKCIGNITVYLNDVETTIKSAEIIGDLAVHEHLEVWGKWAVTHMPTQVSFMKAVPSGNYTKEQLINWCKKVQETFKEEWSVLRSLTHDNYLDDNWNVGRTKDIIQAHCKNVRME